MKNIVIASRIMHLIYEGIEELYTENKCYILNLQNVRATKIGKNSESKEIL
jgi:hypothetical protein